MTSKTLQKACQTLRDKVRFRTASFKLPGERMASEESTAIIREATRLYVESWIIPIIDAIEKGDTRTLRERCE